MNVWCEHWALVPGPQRINILSLQGEICGGSTTPKLFQFLSHRSHDSLPAAVWPPRKPNSWSLVLGEVLFTAGYVRHVPPNSSPCLLCSQHFTRRDPWWTTQLLRHQPAKQKKKGQFCQLTRGRSCRHYEEQSKLRACRHIYAAYTSASHSYGTKPMILFNDDKWIRLVKSGKNRGYGYSFTLTSFSHARDLRVVGLPV